MPVFRPLFIALALVAFAAGHAQSPYAGEQERDIKALSADRIAGLEAGRGLGYAKAAELNGYPGPKHVLELAEELELTAGQRARTRELFESMQRHASELGRELVAAEAELDRAFAEGTISSDSLAERVAQAARIEGELRRVHLDAHIRQTELLEDPQVAEYMALRGYHARRKGHGHEHRH